MTAAAQLAIGDIVGPYRIVGELGGGGMGMVYRAVHGLLHRPAAIKVLRPELGGYVMAGDRFLTEARATTAIRHPGIVEVFDYGHTPAGCAFIAMELLEGRTLGARLAERGPLPVAEALAIARRIAAPLAAAHERGVVHRDLKPDNVFLIRDPEGGELEQVKLLDFGIAKLDSTATAHRTTIGLVLGTPAYMSPEQCLGTSACDHRTDLYALGCILFEMLTGRPPYHAVPTGDLLAAHIQRPIPDLGKLVSVPPDVARLASRLLAKSASDRPRTAHDVVGELDRLATRERAPTRRGSLRVALGAASGLALSLSALGAWYRWWRTGEPGEPTAPTDAPTRERPPVAVGTRPLSTAPTVYAPPPDAPAAERVPTVPGKLSAARPPDPPATGTGARMPRRSSEPGDAPKPAKTRPTGSTTEPGDAAKPAKPPQRSAPPAGEINVIDRLGSGGSGGVDTPVQD